MDKPPTIAAVHVQRSHLIRVKKDLNEIMQGPDEYNVKKIKRRLLIVTNNLNKYITGREHVPLENLIDPFKKLSNIVLAMVAIIKRKLPHAEFKRQFERFTPLEPDFIPDKNVEGAPSEPPAEAPSEPPVEAVWEAPT